MADIGPYLGIQEIPSYVDNLQQLEILDLSSSNLAGSIPAPLAIYLH